MTRRLVCADIADGPRKMIHAVRVLDELLDLEEINEIASKMREQMLAKHGVQYADEVVVQGSSKETLRPIR